MRVFIEPIKRLYTKGSITIEQLEDRLNNGKLTQEEFDYIVK